MVDHWSVRSITRALLPILLVLTVLELVGGLTLGSFEATLLQYPTLLVLVPVMIGTAGNLGSILSARLSTAFHLGMLSFDPTDDRLLGNTITTVLLAVSVFPIVGAGGWGIVAVTGDPQLSIGMVVSVALASGLILAFLAILVTVVATYTAYRFELDPDDVVIPVVTNVCDVLGVLVLFAVVQLLVP
ncbi:magnesium transporter [Halobaculum roseum]|uniref:Magnesium transporter n=1 Tax=Halobaculum roseum TaxID=2175149 RepID=A0ABD5MK09_9EURY|nr:magnesium transporter [Halobaculum roseum]QZY04329.1 magnesium transporter [Halobaculum roseum]